MANKTIINLAEAIHKVAKGVTRTAIQEDKEDGNDWENMTLDQCNGLEDIIDRYEWLDYPGGAQLRNMIAEKEELNGWDAKMDFEKKLMNQVLNEASKLYQGMRQYLKQQEEKAYQTVYATLN